MPKKLICPSILAADFSRLGDEVRAAEAAGADMIHFDVMDNHFVPNLSFGPMVCKSLTDAGVESPIDAHLMTEPVDGLIESFADAGADYISFHPHASADAAKSLALIKDKGCRGGLALSPERPLDEVAELLDELDLLLVMSVNPGFGGQKFIPETLDKLRAARRMIDASGRDILLQVDGGVKVDNMAEISAAGADAFVVGTALFGADDYVATIRAMRERIGG